MIPIEDGLEWIEADGLGGFASGSAAGVRTRRYHALLLASAAPPTQRLVLVNGVDAWLDAGDQSFPLSSQVYEPGITSPAGVLSIERFEINPWPTWTFALPNGDRVMHEVFVPKGSPAVVLSWRLINPRGSLPRTLRIRPFFSGRDYHALHHENAAFAFEPAVHGSALAWRAYAGVPGVLAFTNAKYRHAPEWYRAFLYREERARGFDALEDLAAPGEFSIDLSKSEALLVFGAQTPGLRNDLAGRPINSLVADLRDRERDRRAALGGPLERAADAYIVKRGEGKTIIAGYPWFADWGRDTFIALRGLCLATGRLEDARSVLLRWASEVSHGMLPNRFPDSGDEPEFNSVDASLWFVIVAHELIEKAADAPGLLSLADRAALLEASESIVSGYAAGTRFNIRMDTDGLLSAGVEGQQLTWMDARIGERIITPRIGKPVEVQALWINALWLMSMHNDEWREPCERATRSFRMKFWNESRGCLFDVIDVDHTPGAVDAAVRPNQLFALGGLPLPLLDPVRAARVLVTVEADLLTPVGLRSLAPGEPGYAARYEGGPVERDERYHQGTVWPWLMGAFIEAWVRLHGRTRESILEARSRFFDPWMKQCACAGGGHIPEIADAEPPHTPRGCPFQAWSVGEALRVDRVVLALPEDSSISPAASSRGSPSRRSDRAGR